MKGRNVSKHLKRGSALVQKKNGLVSGHKRSGPASIKKLIVDLDSPVFSTRETASKELMRLGRVCSSRNASAALPDESNSNAKLLMFSERTVAPVHRHKSVQQLTPFVHPLRIGVSGKLERIEPKCG
jgi:hypothetical protein